MRPARNGRDQSGKRKRILIVDDHPMIREHLAQLINQAGDLLVCGEAETAPMAMEKLDELRPDLAIVDLSLNGSSGLELIKDMKAVTPELPILVLSMHDETRYAPRALRAGASGYINKHEATEKVMEAIRRVLAGELYVSEKVAGLILRQFVGQPHSVETNGVSGLTDRELEVFQLIGQGRSTREIAEALRLSVKTIEAHRANMSRKLNVTNAVELTQLAVHWVEREESI
jgi:DNA-binding NarL/FixJ family response regulator